MNKRRRLVYCNALTLLCLVALIGTVCQAQAKGKYACDEPNPASLCTAANTCGSPSAACSLDVTKALHGANVKPSIPGASNNQLFCVKSGTTITWMSSRKNIGFMVSFGTDTPFSPDETIMGGGSKQVSLKAAKPGCYKYDVGAFISGIAYGMGSGSKPEMVVLP